MWEVFHNSPRTYWELGCMLCVHVKAWSGTVTPSEAVTRLLSLPFLASFCWSVSHPFGFPPSPPAPPFVCPLWSHGDGSEWHGLSWHSGAAFWIIGLCGAKTWRWEREWKDFSFISPSFQNSNKAIIPFRALFLCFPNSKQSVCFSDSREATLRPIDSQCFRRREKEYWICLHYHFPIRVLL